jgi:XTP/dITP diphosphohydrolase
VKKLVIATRNHNKFEEMKKVLGGLDWELVPAYEFPGAPEVEEDGKTLEENSFKKAKALSDFTGLPALADDTGLFVEVLGGQPGVYSARFAGENCTDQDNVRKLLELMKHTPSPGRRAIFRTAITIYYPDRAFQQAIGEVEGRITEDTKGDNGFGYDPVFMPNGFSRVFAEMTLEEKNQISHRGLAIQKAKQLLQG